MFVFQLYTNLCFCGESSLIVMGISDQYWNFVSLVTMQGRLCRMVKLVLINIST